jgi:hypothetical protein
MGLAPSFAKAAQAARQVLSDFDLEAFRKTLESTPVAVGWDRTATTTTEGRATLDLVVDLLARLYPEVRLKALDSNAQMLTTTLEERVRLINPNVALSAVIEEASIMVVVGSTRIDNKAGVSFPTVIYAGSDAWIAKFSRQAPVGSGSSQNVFGAGAAACFAAANVFRSVFADQLTNGDVDSDFSLSLVDFELKDDATGGIANPRLPPRIDLGDTHLVGVGAIGHGSVWALRRTVSLFGTLYLVDPEYFDDTNPQRYVETNHDATGAKAFSASARNWISKDLSVLPRAIEWSEHIAQWGEQNGWGINRAALALDTAEDRVMVQGALPKHIYNAWTRLENLGISRHDFLSGPCVSCLYMREGPTPNYDELVAKALRITDPVELKRVRFYLDTGAPLDANALQWIAARRGLSAAKREQLDSFAGCQLRDLYVRGLCGGLLLSLGESREDGEAEVPLAFQSALAGVLLAAEVVIDAAGLRLSALPARTEVNLLRPIGTRLNSHQQRPITGNCLCQDAAYVDVYTVKYPPCGTSGSGWTREPLST